MAPEFDSQGNTLCRKGISAQDSPIVTNVFNSFSLLRMTESSALQKGDKRAGISKHLLVSNYLRRAYSSHGLFSEGSLQGQPMPVLVQYDEQDLPLL